MSIISVNARIRWIAVVSTGFYAALSGPFAATVHAIAVESNIQCYQIPNARIVLDRSLIKNKAGMANFGHSISAGSHTVISIRRFDDLGPPDSQSFFKTTIELKIPGLVGKSGYSEIPVIYSFHSQGNSGFIFKGAYDWAEFPLETVSIKLEPAGLRIRFSKHIRGIRAASGETIKLPLEADCLVRKVMVQELNFWQGRKGTDFQPFYP